MELRGHGCSINRLSDWDIDQYVKDLNMLIDSIGITKPILIGHSLGGMISQSYAKKYGDKLKALVLVNTTDNMKKRWAKYNPQKVKFVDSIFWFAKKLPMPLITKPGFEFVRHFDFSAKKALDIVQSYNEQGTTDHIKLKTLVITTKTDMTIPMESTISMQKRIENSQVCILNNGGHQPMYSKPKIFNKVLREFFDSVK